ncbi:MAG TPA: Ig-like domain-containing protein [Candidatus Limnocylindria bacterium]
MEPSRRLVALMAGLCLLGFMAGGGVRASLALLTDSENISADLATAASFDSVPPTVSTSVVSKTVPYHPGYIRQGGTYYVYANVTDGGASPSGVATVTADVSTITTGQTAVALVAGAYSIGGVSYNYRSASVTANASLTEGTYAYTITATDVAGNSATTSGFSVIVDNTRPSGTDVQTSNAGVTGRPEIGDTITLTFSEVIDPESVLSGWTGSSTNVVLRIGNNAGGDRVTIRDSANTAQLPLGTVNLVGTGYVSGNRDFGATGTPSTMVAVGNTIVITLGTASGAVGTQAAANNMTWVPTVTLTDRAGNTCQTTTATEVAPLDLDF